MAGVLLREIRHSPPLWLLVFVPVVFAGEKLAPDAHTALFVAAKTGDAVGGLAPQAS